MSKQKDIAGLPTIDVKQQASMFDLCTYSTRYAYALGKRIKVNADSLNTSAYTLVTVDSNSDITWRELAYLHMGKFTIGWWVIPIFNNVDDATIFPADLCPVPTSTGEITSTTIIVPTVDTFMNFIDKVKNL